MKITLTRNSIIGFAALIIAVSCVGTFPASPALAALYDSDATAVTGGPLLDRDYWRANWDAIRLEDALKERQPEGAMLIAVIGQVQLLDELIKNQNPDVAELERRERLAATMGAVMSVLVVASLVLMVFKPGAPGS